jgi:hypothetical protein
MLEHSLAERYRALVRWDGTKLPAFSTYSARVRSFYKGWPNRLRNVEEFSAAEFFYTGMDLPITPVSKSYSFTLQHITILLLLQVWMIKPEVFIVGAVWRAG